METNAKIKAEQIFKDLCKIITAPSGQDARVSDIDKIVAKNCAVYLVDKIIYNYEEKYKYCSTKIFWQEVIQEINQINN